MISRCPGTESSQTLPRREADSNLQFRVDGAVETGTDLNVRAGFAARGRMSPTVGPAQGEFRCRPRFK